MCTKVFYTREEKLFHWGSAVIITLMLIGMLYVMYVLTVTFFTYKAVDGMYYISCWDWTVSQQVLGILEAFAAIITLAACISIDQLIEAIREH